MMRARPLAALWCLAALAPPGLAARQGRVLRGEVLSREGQPLENVRIEIVDHPPEVHLLDGGRFVHNLVGTPVFVSVRVLSDSLTVLFPPGGRILLPADANAYVPIMVGPRTDQEVLERVQAEMDRFRSILLAHGADAEAVERAVSLDLQYLRQELAARDARLVEMAVSTAQAGELRSRIFRVFDDYRRELSDLVTGLDLLYDGDRPSVTRLNALLRTIAGYNRSVEELKAYRSEMVDGVTRYWPEGERATVADRLDEALGLVLEIAHPTALGLNDDIVAIHGSLAGEHVPEARLRAARESVEEAVRVLTEVLPRTRVAIDELFAAIHATQGGG